MSLDDRLRQAHRRQLDDVKNRVAGTTLDESRLGAASGRSSRLVAVAAVCMLAVGAIGALAFLNRASEVTVETEIGDSGGADGNTTSSERPIVTIPPPPSTEESPEEGAQTRPTMTPSVPAGDTSLAPEVTASVPSSSLATAETTTEPTAPPTTGATSTTTAATIPSVVVSAGLPNSVCPSGRRAELERASLRYVGENTGWNRLDDLVDEQEGPFYFEAWEPGYPNPVTVEVTLAQPVRATDIRVAQDPFTPVSGTITIETGGTVSGTADTRTIELQLSGTEGWKAAGLAGVTLESFTISREVPEANIMEVMVCVEG